MMLFVIATCSSIAFLRVKSEPFRQSLFENFTKNYRNTVEFCAIFSIFNLYVYTLAFVYAPAKNASLGQFKRKNYINKNKKKLKNFFCSILDTDYKDNPTFSMLNDTDGGEDEEDVVYG